MDLHSKIIMETWIHGVKRIKWHGSLLKDKYEDVEI
jgi:hypothetical protein